VLPKEDHTLITIGITCFNAEDTIEKAIKGALQQDWPNLEIIIVDDFSTDSSAEKLCEAVKTDTRIKVITHEENKGFPSALNTIVEHAEGEFIALFDDDDISRNDRLTLQRERIVSYEQEKRTDMILCYSNRDIQMPTDDEPKYSSYAIGRHAPEPFGSMVADYILLYSGVPEYTWGIFGSCTLMARKEVYKKIGKFDPFFRRTAEWDFAVRASFINTHFIAVDQPLILQAKTISSDKSEKISQHYKIELRKKHKNYLKKKHAYLASMAIAYAGNRHHKLKYYTVRILSVLLAPQIYLASKLNISKRVP
jgi:glycosyltransferase involved in cell wall biosynthesis